MAQLKGTLIQLIYFVGLTFGENQFSDYEICFFRTKIEYRTRSFGSGAQKFNAKIKSILQQSLDHWPQSMHSCTLISVIQNLAHKALMSQRNWLLFYCSRVGRNFSWESSSLTYVMTAAVLSVNLGHHFSLFSSRGASPWPYMCQGLTDWWVFVRIHLRVGMVKAAYINRFPTFIDSSSLY